MKSFWLKTTRDTGKKRLQKVGNFPTILHSQTSNSKHLVTGIVLQAPETLALTFGTLLADHIVVCIPNYLCIEFSFPVKSESELGGQQTPVPRSFPADRGALSAVHEAPLVPALLLWSTSRNCRDELITDALSAPRTAKVLRHFGLKNCFQFSAVIPYWHTR